MRKYTYILLLANFALINIELLGQPAIQNSRQQAIEALFSYHDRMDLADHQSPTEPRPTITFHAYITHKTSLKGLTKIKRRVARRLGIQVSFHNLQFNNMGLASISVDARSADTIYKTTVNGNLMSCSDFGIFEMAYGTKRQCFIGSRASLPERLHLLIAKRS